MCCRSTALILSGTQTPTSAPWEQFFPVALSMNPRTPLIAYKTTKNLNMKSKTSFAVYGPSLAFVLCLLATLNPQLSTVLAQGTAFTYQGRLNDGGNPAWG